MKNNLTIQTDIKQIANGYLMTIIIIEEEKRTEWSMVFKSSGELKNYITELYGNRSWTF